MKFSTVLLPTLLMSPAFAHPAGRRNDVAVRGNYTSLRNAPQNNTRVPTFNQSDAIVISIMPRSPEPKKGGSTSSGRGTGSAGKPASGRPKSEASKELRRQITEQLKQMACDQLSGKAVAKINALTVDSLKTLGGDIGLPISVPDSDIKEIKKLGVVAQNEIIYQIKKLLLGSVDSTCKTNHVAGLGQSPVKQVIDKACTSSYAAQFRSAIYDGNLKDAIAILNDIPSIDQSIKDGTKQLLEVLDKSGVFFDIVQDEVSENMVGEFEKACPKESSSFGINLKIPQSLVAIGVVASILFNM
jgi:hypothetical protein